MKTDNFIEVDARIYFGDTNVLVINTVNGKAAYLFHEDGWVLPESGKETETVLEIIGGQELEEEEKRKQRERFEAWQRQEWAKTPAQAEADRANRKKGEL